MTQPSPSVNVSTSVPKCCGGNTAFAGSLACLLLRVALGAVFFYHGGQKCFGWFGGNGVEQLAQMTQLPVLPAIVWAWMAAGAEFGCGVLVLVGLLTRLATIPLIVTMLVAIGTVTGKNGFSLMHGGYEYNTVLIAMAGSLLLTGPGLVSVDAYVFRRSLWSRGYQPAGK